MRLKGSGSYGPYSARAVPASLHASLMARLDRLGPAKEVAQIGAAWPTVTLAGKLPTWPLVRSVIAETGCE